MTYARSFLAAFRSFNISVGLFIMVSCVERQCFTWPLSWCSSLYCNSKHQGKGHVKYHKAHYKLKVWIDHLKIWHTAQCNASKWLWQKIPISYRVGRAGIYWNEIPIAITDSCKFGLHAKSSFKNNQKQMQQMTETNVKNQLQIPRSVWK